VHGTLHAGVCDRSKPPQPFRPRADLRSRGQDMNLHIHRALTRSASVSHSVACSHLLALRDAGMSQNYACSYNSSRASPTDHPGWGLEQARTAWSTLCAATTVATTVQPPVLCTTAASHHQYTTAALKPVRPTARVLSLRPLAAPARTPLSISPGSSPLSSHRVNPRLTDSPHAHRNINPVSSFPLQRAAPRLAALRLLPCALRCPRPPGCPLPTPHAQDAAPPALRGPAALRAVLGGATQPEVASGAMWERVGALCTCSRAALFSASWVVLSMPGCGLHAWVGLQLRGLRVPPP
jgi:hypothetical protein